jgi:hypothetical protein
MDTVCDKEESLYDFTNVLLREAERQRAGLEFFSVEELIELHTLDLHNIAVKLRSRGLAPSAPTELANHPTASTDSSQTTNTQRPVRSTHTTDHLPVYTNESIQQLTNIRFSHKQLNAIKHQLQLSRAYNPKVYPELHKLPLLPTPTHTERLPISAAPQQHITPLHTAWHGHIPASVRLPPPSKYLPRTTIHTTKSTNNRTNTHPHTHNTRTNSLTQPHSTNPHFTSLVTHINSLLRLLHSTHSWEAGIPTRLQSSVNTFISSIHPPAPSPSLEQQLNTHSQAFLRHIRLTVTTHNNTTYTRLLADLSALNRQDYALAESVVRRQLKRSHPHLTQNTITQYLTSIHLALSNSSHTATHSPMHTSTTPLTQSATLPQTNTYNNATDLITHVTPTPSKRRLSPSPKPQRTPKVAKRSILREHSGSISPSDSELVQFMTAMEASPDSFLADIESTYDYVYDPDLGCTTIQNLLPTGVPSTPSLNHTITTANPRTPAAKISPTAPTHAKNITEHAAAAPSSSYHATVNTVSYLPPTIHTSTSVQSHSWKLKPKLQEHNILVIADSNGATWTSAPPNWCIYSFSGLRFQHIENILLSTNDLNNYEHILIHVGINDVYNYTYAVKYSLPAFISLLNTSKLPLLYIPHPQNTNTLQSIQTKIQHLITAPIEQCENRVIHPTNITYTSKNDKTNKHYSTNTATEYIKLILQHLN